MEMNIRRTIIETSVWLRQRNSPCGYDDFYNVLRKKVPDQTLNRIDWKRIMRHLKERGTFYGGNGRFVINNSVYERMKK